MGARDRSPTRQEGDDSRRVLPFQVPPSLNFPRTSPYPSPMSVAISLAGVVKRFGKFAAVDHLDLEIPHGVTFGLLGPNGAGKTTTIRMIMNITKPDEGTIRVLGQTMSEALQERIGY